MYKLCVLVLIVLLSSCGTRESLAPVVELKWQPHNAHTSTHKVLRGETLYAIAFRYDLDYRQLAAINHLRRPYSLRVGQVLNVRAGSRARPATQFSTRNSRSLARSRSPQKGTPNYYSTPKNSWSAASMRGQKWLWPAEGRVAARFAPQQGRKGIDIAGKKGEKIHAAAGGVVAYSGNGLSGYGNLIIIKHNDEFLTAYGNNAKNIVKEGQKVKAGQIIAEMGVIDRHYWGVHFEIRKDGKPVNPLEYLRKN
ncbi:Murein hydrolase activator NlpD precursor [Legionella massiliensis]|uniref:Murein hydrolase activator NlpD n=1 Tax=Legionella massiliensis TaxID=1034943 RepID=A0A078L282_9GAMM|nr:peptidoglycan DD-metalloendopeptidase family protein [Legionella massiliensis]CDZ78189.1 Murein hydrolase activator NlpD precursor [Legionella massiliensis]CEE13927.1 Murein hydrolase activator NlpD precursor [Legionella massiliensis]